MNFVILLIMWKNVFTFDDAFKLKQKHVVTQLNKDTYTNEWNYLKFSDFKIKYPSQV